MKAVKRLKVESYEGKTPALGDGQVRVLPDVLGIETLKGRSPAYPTLNPVFLFSFLARSTPAYEALRKFCTLKLEVAKYII